MRNSKQGIYFKLQLDDMSIFCSRLIWEQNSLEMHIGWRANHCGARQTITKLIKLILSWLNIFKIKMAHSSRIEPDSPT